MPQQDLFHPGQGLACSFGDLGVGEGAEGMVDHDRFQGFHAQGFKLYVGLVLKNLGHNDG